MCGHCHDCNLTRVPDYQQKETQISYEQTTRLRCASPRRAAYHHRCNKDRRRTPRLNATTGSNKSFSHTSPKSRHGTYSSRTTTTRSTSTITVTPMAKRKSIRRSSVLVAL